MSKIENPEVLAAFNHYPKPIRQALMRLRQLILDTASETEGVILLEETLKWGEPSYLTKNGSTIRLGWRKSTPDQYALYFNCKTKLVDTFKELYDDLFQLEGNRAMVFNINDKI
ncbi:MAG: DUF1801 domain-containing protein [Proteobacteria bacterium]|nr:DUF1801 domain-containing protein [Pseudomonadota bacterium]